jgi:hypothetical protein
MKYEVLIEMNDNLVSGSYDSPEERFQGAVNCAKGAIADILYGHPVLVDGHFNKITIMAEQSDLFTVSKLEEVLKPAFCDSRGVTHPEFKFVKVSEIKKATAEKGKKQPPDSLAS